jgi:hypothetical protein
MIVNEGLNIVPWLLYYPKITDERKIYGIHAKDTGRPFPNFNELTGKN